MDLRFRGWHREVHVHDHGVSPVTDRDGGYYVSSSETLLWHNSTLAYGKVDNLSLSGCFLIEFHMEPEELSDWLRTYAREHPEEALRLMAAAQAEAVIALASRSQRNDEDSID